MKSTKKRNTSKKNLFEFSKENLKLAKQIIAKYPNNRERSALLPLLDIAQRQNDNWISNDVIDYISDFLGVPCIKVYEVASFYTMFNLKPVGKNFIQICRTTPCWLKGSDKIASVCKKKLGIEIGEITKDGEFSLSEVECLGGCVNSPIVQINDDYYEDLDEKSMEKIIDDLKSGKVIKKGSQKGRQCSAPLTISSSEKAESVPVKKPKPKPKPKSTSGKTK